MQQPKKWYEIYPYGTKEGDEEARFFKVLNRHAKWDWRSTAQIVKETNLTLERVEDIIDKYANKIKPALVYASPDKEEHWAYWERCPEMLKKDERDVSKKDKDNRVDKHLFGTSKTQDPNVTIISSGATGSSAQVTVTIIP